MPLMLFLFIPTKYLGIYFFFNNCFRVLTDSDENPRRGTVQWFTPVEKIKKRRIKAISEGLIFTRSIAFK